VEEHLVEDDLQRPRFDHPGEGVDQREDDPGYQLAATLPHLGQEVGEYLAARAHRRLVCSELLCGLLGHTARSSRAENALSALSAFFCQVSDLSA
jgi:hypothetical protein